MTAKATALGAHTIFQAFETLVLYAVAIAPAVASIDNTPNMTARLHC